MRSTKSKANGDVWSLRLYAFLGVVCSTAGITACLISFPLVFTYVQRMQAAIRADLDFCQIKSRHLYREMIKLHQGESASLERLANAASLMRDADWKESVLAARIKRANGAGPSEAAPTTGCCTCHKGALGAQGPPGNPGRDGPPGEEGKAGENGIPAVFTTQSAADIPTQCPCEGPPGELGPAGPKGSPGAAGKSGPTGDDGKGGDNGLRGEGGKAGEAGKSGLKGPPGDDGPVIPAKDIPAGPQGNAGVEGPPGPIGPVGLSGKGGPDGKLGEAGDKGLSGPDGKGGANGKPGSTGAPGPRGSCSHCPPPRTAPGY